ncbi:MAG: hypothetical protein HYR94_28740 [Chloroflexi bacterium]|nr:hypothetical protein [Chloroflexota bacterium]
MKELRYTLICDGSSDVALLPLLTWLLREHHVECAIQPEWADLRRLPKPPRGLANKIKQGLDLFPCDLLFVHRDAEREPREVRVAEIRKAVAETVKFAPIPPQVCVVPVRMQEAWLLFDEAALRRAAGNPNGKQPLQFPTIAKWEQLPDPKNVLYDLLREASGLHGSRRKKFRVDVGARRVAEFISDFAPLRILPAFNALETDLENLITAQGWASPLMTE